MHGQSWLQRVSVKSDAVADQKKSKQAASGAHFAADDQTV
jgi:hypothetical protein